jgi:Tfp pilus assembly protein PilF
MKHQYTIRLILIFLLMFFGLLLQWQKGLYAAWYLYAAAVLLLAGQVLFGTVLPAFHLLQRGQMDEAAKLLSKTWNPDWLMPRHRAYYYLTAGMMALQKKDPEKAEPMLLKSLKLNPGRPIDRAFLCLNLAHIQYLKKEYQACREFLELAKAEPVEDLHVKEHIQQLEKALANLS